MEGLLVIGVELPATRDEMKLENPALRHVFSSRRAFIERRRVPNQPLT